jgi:hypothetical protein
MIKTIWTEEEWKPICTKFAEANKATRLQEVLKELFQAAPKGLSGPEIATNLGLKSASNIRHYISSLKPALRELFFNGACVPEPYFIQIVADRYRLKGWPRDELPKNPTLRQEMETYRSSSEKGPEGTIGEFVANAVALADWNDGRLFEELLDQIKTPDPDLKAHDLRIITSAFSHRQKDGRSLLGLLKKALERGVKISILLINPTNVPLVEARFRLRKDMYSGARKGDAPTQKAVGELYEQLDELSELIDNLPSKSKDCLKIKLANTMPLGFVALSAHRALLGLFIARTSATDTPHIEAMQGTRLWTALKDDWDDRWLREPLDLAAFRASEEFWGSAMVSGGKIVLQVDRAENLAVSAGIKSEAAARKNIDERPSSRVYKAREWVNKSDVEAAIAIRDQFQKEGTPAPALVQALRGESVGTAPFVLSLGLGFADETTGTVECRCDWMRVTNTSKWGDVFSLHKDLVTSDETKQQFARLQLELKDDGDTDFRCVLPSGWEVEQWDSGKDRVRGRDYAIIFRYTTVTEDRGEQLRFVVGGYTERATAVAGRYLAANWRKIQFRVPKGDFLLLMSGPSNSAVDIDKWTAVKDCWIVTPAIVEANQHEWRSAG